MRHAVIMAGGAGKRLWPASRQNKPKQLIPMIGGKSLLDVAVGRLDGLFEPDHVLIVTSAAYADQIRGSFPALPAENVVGEPEGRDTANAIALAAEIIRARDDDATMAVFTADHIIRPVERFARCVRQACETAESHPGSLVTFGIRPTSPHTGLGYIHFGDMLETGPARRVLGFKEKPDHHTARTYVDSGQYYWNSGMFVWRVDTIRQAMAEFLPESARKLARVGDAAKAGEDINPILAEVYPQLPKISIDYAVMEKSSDVLMVELTCQWLDVGSWPALADVVDVDADNNATVAPRAVVLDGTGNVIYSENEHLLAVVGMDDCIIVHTPDATLVCNKSDSQRLKELLDMVIGRFGSDYA